MSQADDLEKLIAIHRQRLQQLKVQQAIGGISTDPAITMEIEQIEATVGQLRAELAELGGRPASLPPPQTDQDTSALGRAAAPPHLAEPERSASNSRPASDQNSSVPKQTQVDLPSSGLKDFGSQQVALLQQLYPDEQRVMVEREFGGGFGGTRVFLVRPINQRGAKLARQIVKIGPPLALQQEQQNYLDYVKKAHPFVAAEVTRTAEWQGLGGIIYNFVGDSRLGETRTLEEVFQDEQVSAEAINQTLEALLDKALGDMWYHQTAPHICFFDDEYGPHLAEHLRVKLRPASQDGLWQVGQTPGFVEGYRLLDGETIGRDYAAIAAESLVQIEGLVVRKVKPHEIKLQHPLRPGLVIKVELLAPPNLGPGEMVSLRGEVRYNRQSRLEAIVSKAFVNFPEAPVDPQAETLTWGDKTYPNPLKLYPQILSQTLDGRKSLVHGDLHLRNVLVDESGHGWLIDFALVKERHNLYDFIKLETYIRQMVLSQPQYDFSFADYLRFEEALLDETVTVLEDPALRKAYQVIRKIRALAARYAKRNFYEEYLPALFLYNLAMLKYAENHGAKAARLAFGTGGVVGGALTKSPQSQPKRQIEIHLKGDFSSLSPDRRIAAIDAFAVLMGISPQVIDVYSVHAGSIAFKLGVPSTGVDRLRSLLETNDAQLRLLKVEKVILKKESGEIEEWVIKAGEFNLVTSRPPTPPSDSLSDDLGELHKDLQINVLGNGAIATTGGVAAGAGGIAAGRDVHIKVETFRPLAEKKPTQFPPEHLTARLKPIRQAIRQRLQAVQPEQTESYFDHVDQVIQYLAHFVQLLPADKRVGELEAFTLVAAAYLHDIGRYFPQPDQAIVLKNRMVDTDQPDAAQIQQLMQDYYHELSWEWITNSLIDNKYPLLGLKPTDPVSEIALVCLGHRAANLADERYRASDSGLQQMRPALLAALLSMADMLVLVAAKPEPAALEQSSESLEKQVYAWLNYYLERISIQKGHIRFHYQLPPDGDNLSVRVLLSGPIQLRLREIRDVLTENGLVIALDSAVTSGPVRKMPPEVLAHTQKLAQQRLTSVVAALGQPKKPQFSYQFTGLRQPSTLQWPAITGADRYRCQLFDLNQKLLHQWETTDLEITLAQDQVELEVKYEWITHAYQGRKRLKDSIGGIFWLINKPTIAWINRAMVWYEDLPSSERQLMKARILASNGLYDEASSLYHEVLEQENESMAQLQARQALIEMYEDMSRQLNQLGKHSRSDQYLDAALTLAKELQTRLDGE